MTQLDTPGVMAVKEAVDRVARDVKDVREHLREGVTGVGLEDALNELNEAAYDARTVYGREANRVETEA